MELVNIFHYIVRSPGQTAEIFSLSPTVGLKAKSNGQTNFYECCDLTKKVYLVLPHRQKEIPESQQNVISSTSEISLYCDFLGLQIGSIWSRILKIGSV